MEYFAAELWRSGKRAWSVGDVEQWLIDFLRARPALAAHYDGKDRELLKEDLRTATFLVRDGRRISTSPIAHCSSSSSPATSTTHCATDAWRTATCLVRAARHWISWAKCSMAATMRWHSAL